MSAVARETPGVPALPAPGSSGAFVYVDSPMPNALDQILPFFADGFFDAASVPVLIRQRSRANPGAKRKPGALPLVHPVKPAMAIAEHVRPGSTIYYPFNSQSNVTLVSNRLVRHVLILHGESNKVASFRPAARLYDYIVVAGDLGCRRYLKAGIFTRREAELGRLVKMGDTLVQTMPYLDVARPEDEGWVLYAPTWETRTRAENYSSAEGGYGFELARRCADDLGLRNLLIKPHPNYGMHDTDYLRHLINFIKRMTASGYVVRMLTEAMNWRVRLALRLYFGASVLADTTKVYPVAFALVDVSGMEAICLKQRIPHMVVQKANTATAPHDEELLAIYARKTFLFGEAAEAGRAKFRAYMDESGTVDMLHRDLVFSYTDGSLSDLPTNLRFAWLNDYVRRDPYWSGETRTSC